MPAELKKVKDAEAKAEAIAAAKRAMEEYEVHITPNQYTYRYTQCFRKYSHVQI